MNRARAFALIAGAMLIGGSAVAQEGAERRPVGDETLVPVTIDRRAVRVNPEARIGGLERLRTLPRMTPFGPAESPENEAFRDMARRAQVQAADQALEVSGVTPQSAASITEAFRGINIFEAGVFRGNEAVFAVPPDPQVAASTGRVVHVVNSAIRMFRRNGERVQTLDLNNFFGIPVGPNFESFLFDPKIIFDVNAPRKRFYVVALETNAGAPPPNFSFIHLAVSRSANPGNLNPDNWCFYRINARGNQGTEVENWADYPSIGAGTDALVITTNQFTFQDFSFLRNVVRAIRKLPLSNNAESCPSSRLFTFDASDEIADVAAFTLQPAQQLTKAASFPGTTNPVYLTSTIFDFTTTYRVWRLRNVATTPSLSFRHVDGDFEYGTPPLIPQRNEAGFLDSGDHRMMEAAGVGNAVWSTHATVCTLPGSVIVSCARVLRFVVGQNASGGLRAQISQQATFGAANSFLFWPGIAVNREETVAVPFHFVSADRTENNLSTWWVVKNQEETDYQPLRPLTTGQCQQVVTRTGDYSGAETDPVDLRSFWLSGERARRIAEFGNDCLWETRIIRVTPSSSVASQAP